MCNAACTKVVGKDGETVIGLLLLSYLKFILIEDVIEVLLHIFQILISKISVNFIYLSHHCYC